MSSEKEYVINHSKPRDACTIVWEANEYKISELEPYITNISCDDGENIYHLWNKDSPESEGKDDFKTIELNDFEAVQGDANNEYFLCFDAVVKLNLNDHPIFKKALGRANNSVIARIHFKKNNKPLVDDEGFVEYLFELGEDVAVQLENPEYI